MFENQLLVADRANDFEAEVYALEQTLQPLAAAPVPPRNPGFQFPRRVWLAMFACYAIFFFAISAATGGSGHARFATANRIRFHLDRKGCRARPAIDAPVDGGSIAG